jgi:hypothetical protein
VSVVSTPFHSGRTQDARIHTMEMALQLMNEDKFDTFPTLLQKSREHAATKIGATPVALCFCHVVDALLRSQWSARTRRPTCCGRRQPLTSRPRTPSWRAS